MLYQLLTYISTLTPGTTFTYKDICIACFCKPYKSWYLASRLEAKAFKNQITDKQRYQLETVINRDINQLREIVRECGADKETNSNISKTIVELMNIQHYL